MHTVGRLETEAGCARTRRVNTAFIWAAVFAVGSLPVCAMAARAVWPACRTIFWTTAPGMVLSSRVEPCPDPRHPRLYACRVEYSFVLDGKERRGRRIRPVEIFGPIEAAAADEARYAPGSACTVRVDPSNPDAAVLDPSVGAVPWALGGVGLLAALASLLFFLSGRSRRAP